MRPLPPQHWHPSLRHIIDDMQGKPINIHCLLANHPPLLEAWWTYRMYSVRGGSLDKRDVEIVILRVAVHARAWYEWAAHVDRGLAAGLTMGEIERIATGPGADGWNAQDATLLESVDRLVQEHGLHEEGRCQLKRFFTEQQVMDIISIQGMYLTIACLIGTWDIPIEDELAQRLPANVSKESFAALLSAANDH